MRQESHGFLRFAPEATAENGSHQRSRLPARVQSAESYSFLGALSCTDRVDKRERVSAVSTGDLPPTGTRSPLKGEQSRQSRLAGQLIKRRVYTGLQ